MESTTEVSNCTLHVPPKITSNNHTVQSKCQATGSNTLDVLPSNRAGSVGSNSQSLEAKAVINLTRGNSSVVQSSIDLPLRGGSSAPTGTAVARGAVGSRASHEARRTLALEGPVSESVAGSVDEGTVGGASGLVGRVRRSEAQSTLVINVDSLATGDHNVLHIELANTNVEKIHR